jgi:hypothetical protein
MTTMSTNIPLDIEDEMFSEQAQFKDINTALEKYLVSTQLLSNEFVSLIKK